MIEGVGIDVVNIDRFKESLERTPGLSEKLFTESERLLAGLEFTFLYLMMAALLRPSLSLRKSHERSR